MDSESKMVTDAKLKAHCLYSGHTPVTASELTEEHRSVLIDRQEHYDASPVCIADWAAAFADAEKRMDQFVLSEKERLYLLAATMNSVTAGLENQLVMYVEDTIRYEDPQFLSQEQVIALADRIRGLSYFEQLVLMYRAKKEFDVGTEGVD